MFSTIRRSWRLLSRRQKFGLSTLGLARAAVNFLDVIGIALVGAAITVLLGTIDSIAILDGLPSPFRDSPLWLLLLTAVAFITKTVVALLLSRKTAIFIAAVEVHNSKKIAASLLSRGLEYLKQRSRSEIEWTILRSTGIAFGTVLLQSMTLQAEASLTLLVLGLMLMTDWQVTVAITIYFAVIFGLFQWFSSARFQAAGSQLSAGSVSVGRSLSDIIGAYREIFVSGNTSFFLETFGRARELVARSTATSSYLQSIPRLAIETALILGACFFLAFEILRSSGEPNFASLALVLVGGLRIMSSLLPLQRSFAELKFIKPQAEAAQSLLEEIFGRGAQLGDSASDNFERTKTESPDLTVSIEMRNVVFGFKEQPTHVKAEGKVEVEIKASQRHVIDGVSMSVAGGSYVALIGPSGSGKSTLVDLILGLYEPMSGTVLINGVPPRQLLRDHPGIVGYVPQAPGIVSGTVAENIALGLRPDEIDKSRVWETVHAAELTDFVRALPEGLDSDLGAHSDSLSGGQKQRLGLARALYLRPKLLILDEATSALDAQTEHLVTKSLLALRERVTVLVVAHRLSTIKKVDEAFVVVEGKILAQGPFERLRKDVPLIQRYIDLMSFE